MSASSVRPPESCQDLAIPGTRHVSERRRRVRLLRLALLAALLTATLAAGLTPLQDATTSPPAVGAVVGAR